MNYYSPSTAAAAAAAAANASSSSSEHRIYEAVARHDHRSFLECLRNVTVDAAERIYFHHRNDNGGVFYNDINNVNNNNSIGGGGGGGGVRSLSRNTSNANCSESKTDEAHEEILLNSSHVSSASSLLSVDNKIKAGDGGMADDLELKRACDILSEVELRHLVHHLVNCRPPRNFQLVEASEFSSFENQVQAEGNERNGGDGEEGLVIPQLDNNGSLVHLSCICDNVFALSVLLMFGADIRQRHTSFRRLLVHEAACWDSADCLEVLLCAGGFSTINSDILEKEEQMEEKLQARWTFYETITWLMNACDKMEYESGDNTSRSGNDLMIAKQVLQLFKYELPLETNLLLQTLPQQMDGHGNTALHWSAFKNSIKCMKILVSTENGRRPAINPNVRSNQSGWTPLVSFVLQIWFSSVT